MDSDDYLRSVSLSVRGLIKPDSLYWSCVGWWACSWSSPALGWSQHDWPEVPLNIAPHPLLHLPPPSPEIQALHSSDSDEPKRSLKKTKTRQEKQWQFLYTNYVWDIWYPLPFRSLGLVRLFIFNLFWSPRLHLFDQNYSKNSNIVKYYYNLK